MKTLKELIFEKDNDYTDIQKIFENKTGESLYNPNRIRDISLVESPLSIVLPSYNVHRELPITLKYFTYQAYKKFEVIVVDDNSNPSLDLIIDNINVNFPLTYIRIPFNKNKNPNHARNVGLFFSRYNKVICLDSDIIVNPYFTANLGLKLQYTNNCVFLGFRENIMKLGNVAMNGDISKDWRHTIEVNESFDNFVHVNINRNENLERRVVHLLDETENLKNFGFENSIIYWDLPSLVIGNCLAFDKEKAIAAGGFPEIFKGWGVDDIAFGANMIGRGQYIIPSYNSVNFHIVHRSKKDFIKCTEELKNNIKIYFDYVDKPMQGFNSYNVRMYRDDGSKRYCMELEK